MDRERVAEWRKIIDEVKRRGVQPYPHHFAPTHTVKTLNELRRQALLEPWVGMVIKTAGRVTDIRRHPNVVFLDLYEDGARFQVMADPKTPLLDLVWRGTTSGLRAPLLRHREVTTQSGRLQ